MSKGPADHFRRKVYVLSRRNLRFPFLDVFDAPDSNLSCPSHERSTTVPQSLALLNAGELTAAAEALAERLAKDATTPGRACDARVPPRAVANADAGGAGDHHRLPEPVPAERILPRVV